MDRSAQTGRRRWDAVLFDLFHTLVDASAVPGKTSSQILGIDPVVWTETIHRNALHHALGEESDPYESLRRIAHGIDPTIPEERIREAVAARPARFRHALIHVRPTTLATLRAIREGGRKTGLVSNCSHDEIAAWPESPLAALFDTVVFSCREKMAKPDPAIYRLAAERLDVDPTRCLFVGDGGSSEHEGARAVGMGTVLILEVLLASHPRIAAERPRTTDHVIERMPELLPIALAVVP